MTMIQLISICAVALSATLIAVWAWYEHVENKGLRGLVEQISEINWRTDEALRISDNFPDLFGKEHIDYELEGTICYQIGRVKTGRTVLRIRRPTAADFIQVNAYPGKWGAHHILCMIARCCNLPYDAAEQLSLKDFAALSEIVADWQKYKDEQVNVSKIEREEPKEEGSSNEGKEGEG